MGLLLARKYMIFRKLVGAERSRISTDLLRVGLLSSQCPKRMQDKYLASFRNNLQRGRQVVVHNYEQGSAAASRGNPSSRGLLIKKE